jgi:hypothetical protein
MQEIFVVIIIGISIFAISSLIIMDNISIGEYTHEFNVGVYENPPKVFSDSQGQFIGIFPEILNYICTTSQLEN